MGLFERIYVFPDLLLQLVVLFSFPPLLGAKAGLVCEGIVMFISQGALSIPFGCLEVMHHLVDGLSLNYVVQHRVELAKDVSSSYRHSAYSD